ncbi:hypothetical protein LIP_2795 [Limnochorda pilosa]|uniref:Uncharacterized protein n=1 Tax=Limnochorda pilosa TaxID=1555112 RepID=A0A0K2SP76_LIMPI|nr:hypothetical protein LIP_2795 [Limnochorda pilosa]
MHRLVEELLRILGNRLLGIYLHGSLATGGFRPARSDVDLIGISRLPVEPIEKRRLAALLLRLSGSPCVVEFHLLAAEDLDPWRHPAPYLFHFSESWRERLTAEIGDGSWRQWNDEVHVDPDLAAHITVARARGAALYGPPPASVFPLVPPKDYLVSILSDLHWALERFDQDPEYAIMNACRTLAYLETGRVLSKDEGAAWALERLPPGSRRAVRWALGLRRAMNPGRADGR